MIASPADGVHGIASSSRRDRSALARRAARIGIASTVAGALICSCSGASTSSGSLSEAEGEAKRLVNEAAAAIFPDAQGEQSGSGERPCDPPGAGLVSSEYGLEFSVPVDEVDTKAIAGWNHFEELGVALDGGSEPHVGGTYGPAPRGKLGTYRVAITGNRDDSVVYIEVVTPCLRPGS